MTLSTGVVESRNCSDEKLKIMHSRKLDRVMGIVADHHLRQMKDLQAREKLGNLRRVNGFDRFADGDSN